MKKYLFSMLTLALFAVGFAASEDDSSTTSTNDSQTTSVNEKPTASTNDSKVKPVNDSPTEQKKEKKKSFLGTYEVTDKVGCTFRITLNEDETATITGVRGENKTFYGSWTNFSIYKAGIALQFSGSTPLLYFEGGDNRGKGDYCFLNDGWFYSDMSASQAKNPDWRLKATKIR